MEITQKTSLKPIQICKKTLAAETFKQKREEQEEVLVVVDYDVRTPVCGICITSNTFK